MLLIIKEPYLRRLIKSCSAALCMLLYANNSFCQETRGWSEGEPLPINAQRVISEMTVKSQLFQTNQKMLNAADGDLKASLTQLVEQFDNLRVEVDELMLRIIFDSDILFDFDKSSIRPDADTSLQAVANILQRYKGKTIRIVGHTDSKGSDEYNSALSRKRADAVKAWFSSRKDLDGLIFFASGRGKLDPVAPNTLPDGSDNPTGRQKNRRVELEIPNPDIS